MGFVFYAFVLLLAGLMLVFSGSAAEAAFDGLRLFADCVLPSLFPFMVCGRYLADAGLPLGFANGKAGRLSRGFAALLRGALCAVCGTPSAALVCERLSNCGVNVNRSSALCAAMNQMNPYFVIGLLAGRLLGAPRLWWVLASAHYVPSLALTFLIGMGAECDGPCRSAKSPLSPAAGLARALSEATSAILRVGGVVVFFRVLYGVAEACGAIRLLSPAHGAFAAGLLEMTNGLALLTSAQIDGRLCFALCGAVLSFGGACVFMQSKLFFERLRALPYFAVKLALGAVSFVICHLLYPVSGGAVGAISVLDERMLAGRAGETLCLAVCVAFSLAASYVYARLAIRKRTIV